MNCIELMNSASTKLSANDLPFIDKTETGNAPEKWLCLKLEFLRQDKPRRFTMKKSRYSEGQIISILKEAENGVPVFELCRTHGMSSVAFYQWRSKYGGMDASLISEMKQLQAENARLKRMYADIAMQNELVKEALVKK